MSSNNNKLTFNLKAIEDELSGADNMLASLGKSVSFFGSARIQENSEHYKKTVVLAEFLSNLGFVIISGGGPGIMQAANEGAHIAKGASVGLNIKLPHEQVPNQYQSISLMFSEFFPRKMSFFNYSSAFICLPGGFGTLDELFEIVTLVQTKKIAQKPVILYGKKFWEPLWDWIRTALVHEQLISADFEKWFFCVDSKEEILTILNITH